eukprot:COSAG02_NODE_46449_length_348_cov_17.000000_1_plen_65_part_01
MRLFSQHAGDVSSLPSESHVFCSVRSQVARCALATYDMHEGSVRIIRTVRIFKLEKGTTKERNAN